MQLWTCNLQTLDWIGLSQQSSGLGHILKEGEKYFCHHTRGLTFANRLNQAPECESNPTHDTLLCPLK